MSDEADASAAIDAWLLDAREGCADPADTVRVHQLLLARPDLRKYVAIRLMEEALLREELQIAAAESLLGEHAILPVPAGAAPGRSRGRWEFIWYAAALSICAAALAWFVARTGQGPGTSHEGLPFAEDSPMADTEAVAVLTHAVDVVWGQDATPLRVGERIALQTIRMEAGFLQVEFFNGATMVLEGPAELAVASPTRCECRRGKLRVLVPMQATGFTVRAGDVDVVDLGTEFAVQVGADGIGEVHVMDGKVEVRRLSGQHRRLVEGGRAVRFAPGGKLTDLPCRAAGFVGLTRLRTIQASAAAAGCRRWREHSQRWAADPALALYFTFEGQVGTDRQLLGKAGTPGGAIVGCRWVPGRFEGQGALEFKRTSDRVRVNLNGGCRALTLFTWLRVEALEQRFSSLLLADGYSAGKVHWQLTRDGALKFSVSGAGACVSPRFIRPSHLGTWVQLAVVYDSADGSVTHYVDGEPIARSAIVTELALEFGPAEIGNWNPLRPADHAIRNLNGTIDEFAVFRRPLSAQEIGDAYRAGKP